MVKRKFIEEIHHKVKFYISVHYTLNVLHTSQVSRNISCAIIHLEGELVHWICWVWHLPSMAIRELNLFSGIIIIIIRWRLMHLIKWNQYNYPLDFAFYTDLHLNTHDHYEEHLWQDNKQISVPEEEIGLRWWIAVDHHREKKSRSYRSFL